MIESIQELLQKEAQAVLNIPVTDALRACGRTYRGTDSPAERETGDLGMGRAGQVHANEVVKEVSENTGKYNLLICNTRIVNLYEHTVMVTLVSVFVARLLHLDQVRRCSICS